MDVRKFVSHRGKNLKVTKPSMAERCFLSNAMNLSIAACSSGIEEGAGREKMPSPTLFAWKPASSSQECQCFSNYGYLFVES